MQVFVAHRRKVRLFGPPRFEIAVAIHFSKSEMEVIVKNDLGRLIVLERMPSIFTDLDGVWCEKDNNIYLGNLLSGVHIETLSSQVRAKEFERQLLFALEPIRSLFDRYAIQASYVDPASRSGLTRSPS